MRRIVEDLGGTVSLENRDPGPGTVARIELPLAESEDDPHPDDGDDAPAS